MNYLQRREDAFKKNTSLTNNGTDKFPQFTIKRNLNRRDINVLI